MTDSFSIVPRYVIEDAPQAIAVYAAVRLYADYETGECWPAMGTIAEMLGVSKRTVERRLDELVAIGAIAKTSGKAKGETNLYRFPANRIGQWTLPIGYDTGDVPPTTPVSHRGTTRVSHKQEPVEQEPENDIRGRKRPPDPLWDAFVEVHGDPATDSERGKYNRTVGKLREANVTPEEYPTLVAAYTMKHDGLQPAPATIAERVGELRHFIQRGPIRSVSLEDVERRRRFEQLDEERRLG